MRRILAFLTFAFISQFSFSQENPAEAAPIPLNRHYFEIAPEDSINHVYDMLVSYSKDSMKLERIFTLDQKINRVVKTDPATDIYQEEVTDQYNDYSELQWRKTQNLLNKKSLTLYYYNDRLVGQILSDSKDLFHVARNGQTEPTQQNFNDFEPRINGLTEDWHAFIFNQLSLSQRMLPGKTQEFWIAILVNQHGVVDKIEWANPKDQDPKMAQQFIRAIQKWGNNFLPAVDSFGNSVTKWLLVPFRIQGKSES
jgi:hypothetical protein